MRLSETIIPGCLEIQFRVHSDARGSFVKCSQQSELTAHGLDADFTETFFTVSGANVLRGMHLQLPPADHSKLVYCVSGSVADVVLDLRRGSPTFGRHVMIELDADLRNAVYLSRGLAHGFCVRKAPAVMMYHVTSEHVPHLDSGIAWNSFGARWPTRSPLVSPRDSSLPALDLFDSPFHYSLAETELLGTK